MQFFFKYVILIMLGVFIGVLYGRAHPDFLEKKVELKEIPKGKTYTPIYETESAKKEIFTKEPTTTCFEIEGADNIFHGKISGDKGMEGYRVFIICPEKGVGWL